MVQFHLFPITEKVNFCQKFDSQIGDHGCFPELIQNLSLILGIAKESQQSWIQNLVSSICHYLSINIVSIDLNIDRKFENCSHITKFNWYFRFRPKGLIRGGKHLPSGPVIYTWAQKRSVV